MARQKGYFLGNKSKCLREEEVVGGFGLDGVCNGLRMRKEETDSTSEFDSMPSLAIYIYPFVESSRVESNEHLFVLGK